MKIGFLFGSFDPIHIGHLHMISTVFLHNIVDKVIVVPTIQNPWKTNKAASFNDRCTMINMAIQPFGDKVELSTIEENIDGTTYTYKDCQILKEQYKNDDLFIIAGTDVAQQIINWKNFEEEIKPYFGVIEISRNSNKINSNHYKYKSYVNIKTIPLDISSTMIRDMVKNNLNPYPYINSDLINFINGQNLYK